MPSTANRAAQILKEAAMGLRGKKKGPLTTFYNKLAIRRGSNQALKATTHKIARIIYALFTQRTTYDRQKLEPVKTESAITRLTKRLPKKPRDLAMCSRR